MSLRNKATSEITWKKIKMCELCRISQLLGLEVIPYHCFLKPFNKVRQFLGGEIIKGE